MVASAFNPLVLHYGNNGVVTQKELRNHIGAVTQKELRNHISHKHFERKPHNFWEIVQHGEIKVTKITTTNNVTDPFTKAITEMSFNRHLESMGITEMPELLWE